MLHRSILYIIILSSFLTGLKAQVINPKDDESIAIGFSTFGGINLIYGDLLGFRPGFYGGVGVDKEFLKILGVQARYSYGIYKSNRSVKNVGFQLKSSGKYNFLSVGPKLNLIPIFEPGNYNAKYKVFFHFYATYIHYTPSIVWGEAASQKGDMVTGYPDLTHTDNLNKGSAFAYTYGFEAQYSLGNGLGVFANFDIHPTNSDRLDGYTNSMYTNPLYVYDPIKKEIVKRPTPPIINSELKLSKTNDLLVTFDLGVRYLIPYKKVSRNRSSQINRRSSFKFLPSNRGISRGRNSPARRR